MILNVLQQWHQHEQDSFSLHPTITTIQLPVGSLQWERRGKELFVDGRFFDVLAYKIVDGTAFVTGHYDDQESVLEYALNTLRNNNQTQQGNPFSFQQLQWYSFFVSLPPAADDLRSNLFFIPVTQQVYHTPACTQTFYEVPGAPPWC